MRVRSDVIARQKQEKEEGGGRAEKVKKKWRRSRSKNCSVGDVKFLVWSEFDPV